MTAGSSPPTTAGVASAHAGSAWQPADRVATGRMAPSLKSPATICDDGGAVLIGTDVTARHAAEARIAFLTDHDKLTGLPNRWRAASRIRELIAEKSDSARMAALILFDLDGFQDINDTMGHEGGDEF